MDDPRYLVQPVVKALQVLDFVAEQPEGARLSVVASALGLPKTTVFRYLCTLVAAQYVEHDAAQDLYCIATRCRLLGNLNVDAARLRGIAVPAMKLLRDRFEETINLGVIRGRSVIYLEMAEARRRLRMQSGGSDRDPIHSTALGKAILAALPPAERQRRLAAGLPACTARTITSLAAMERELAAIVQRGYAVDLGENEDGAGCVGTAIRDHSGWPVAAISLSAPEGRLTPSLIEEIGAALCVAADRISTKLSSG